MNSIINDKFLINLIKEYSESKEQIILNQLKNIGIIARTDQNKEYYDTYHHSYLKCDECGYVTSKAYVCGYNFPTSSLALRGHFYISGNLRGCGIICCEDCASRNKMIKMITCGICSNITDCYGDPYDVYYCEDCFDLEGSHPNMICKQYSGNQKSKRIKTE